MYILRQKVLKYEKNYASNQFQSQYLTLLSHVVLFLSAIVAPLPPLPEFVTPQGMGNGQLDR